MGQNGSDDINVSLVEMINRSLSKLLDSIQELMSQTHSNSNISI